jgi:hypothetical protein
MSTSWSEYQATTGEFTGRVVEHNIPGLSLPQRDGAAWVAGEYHADTHKVENGIIVARRAPQPSLDHQWDEEIQRWVLRPEVIAKQLGVAAIKAHMAGIDAKKIRPLGALLIDPSNESERAVLAQLEAELAALRQELNQLQNG